MIPAVPFGMEDDELCRTPTECQAFSLVVGIGSPLWFPGGGGGGGGFTALQKLLYLHFFLWKTVQCHTYLKCSFFLFTNRQCCGSGTFVPDPNFPSLIQILDPEQIKYFNPKKFVLSSWKYDPGCLLRIQDPDFFHSESRIQGV
jgi:hypothetical protein